MTEKSHVWLLRLIRRDLKSQIRTFGPRWIEFYIMFGETVIIAPIVRM